MVIVNDGIELDNLVALRRVVDGLERRFTQHNGPFEYGTRLAEESGELIEALYEARAGIKDEVQKEHLLKELQDVLRVSYGIAGIYDLVGRLPRTLDVFDTTADPKEVMSYIVLVGVRSGDLASAINHAEGTGVKKQKHGDASDERMFEAAYNLAQIVAWAVNYFDCEADLERQIGKCYIDYRNMGFIK